MTVEELMEELKAMDPKALVVMSRDSEGNGYSPLDCVQADHYQEDDVAFGWRECTDGSVAAVFLIPIL